MQKLELFRAATVGALPYESADSLASSIEVGRFADAEKPAPSRKTIRGLGEAFVIETTSAGLAPGVRLRRRQRFHI